ncbi:MAG: hypothetical protein FJW86_03215 [Actinobacteria bacterium]|nr:hypothetical protein [Actinomycetota bacterium]
MTTVVEERETTEAPPPPVGGGPPSRPLGVWLDRLDDWAGLLVLAACCAFVFVQLEPGLLLRNSTPAGGDTAAHVWWPAYLRDHLLPWRLAGWSPDFYGGFPAGQFYFPFPALLIVILDLVLPYNVAFKLVTALGPVALPAGAYMLGRGLRAPFPAPAAFAVAMTSWLFFVGDPIDGTIAFNQRIAGGMLASNLAGEFSFTIALAAALAFMGAFAHSLRTGRTMWVPALLLAACVTSHIVVAIFAAVGAAAVWLVSRPWHQLRRAFVIGAVGSLLTTIWVLPLVTNLEYTTDMRYDAIACNEVRKNPGDQTCSDRKDLDPQAYLFPKYLTGVDDNATWYEPWKWVSGSWPWQWGAFSLTLIAVIGAIVRRGKQAEVLGVLMFVALTSAVLFRFWEDVQDTTVWNLRLVPFWYVTVYLLMALGVTEIIRGVGWAARWIAAEAGTMNPPDLIRTITVAALTPIIAIAILIDVNNGKQQSFLPGWIAWNYLGYEDTTGGANAAGEDPETIPKAYPEYRALVNTVDELPPGRLTWEGNSQLNEYGSPLALMLLPYWTEGRIASMEGVYYEASASTPYHFMTVATLAAPGNASNAVRGVPYRDSTQFPLGVRWLQLLGVKYFAAHSSESKAAADADDRLTLVATSPDTDDKPPLGWSIYRVADAPLVEALEYQPVVVTDATEREKRACDQRVKELIGGNPTNFDHHEWQDCIAVPWFNAPNALDRPLVDDGPRAWQRARPTEARSRAKRELPNVNVTNITSTDDSVSFRVDRVGVPVYVKVSYFPNWKVDGARGPYRATPNYMVVVPTEREVTLSYATTGTEWLGRLGTVAGVAGLSVLMFGPWWRRRPETPTDGVTGSPPA